VTVEPLRARWLATTVLLVCTAAVTVTSVVAWYSQRELLDGERWAASVGSVLDDPELRETIAAELTDAVIDAADLERRVEQLLGESAGPFADLARDVLGPVPEQLRGLLQPAIREVLARPQVRDAWRRAADDGPDAVLALLRGESGTFRIVGEELRLDVGTVLGAAADELSRRGGPFGALVAPLIPRELDRTIVLWRSPELPRAQEALVRLDRLVVVAPFVAVTVFALAIAVAPRRLLVAGVAVGAGLVLGLVTWLVLSQVGEGGTGPDLVGVTDVDTALAAVTDLIRTLATWVDRLWAITIWVPVAGVAGAAAVLLSAEPAVWRRADAPPR
jgi:hypothetical protein